MLNKIVPAAAVQGIAIIIVPVDIVIENKFSQAPTAATLFCNFFCFSSSFLAVSLAFWSLILVTFSNFF